MHRTGVCFPSSDRIWSHLELVGYSGSRDIRADVCWPFPHDKSLLAAAAPAIQSASGGWEKDRSLLSLLPFLGVLKESSLSNMNLLFICQNPIIYLHLSVKNARKYSLSYFKIRVLVSKEEEVKQHCIFE